MFIQQFLGSAQGLFQNGRPPGGQQLIYPASGYSLADRYVLQSVALRLLVYSRSESFSFISVLLVSMTSR